MTVEIFSTAGRRPPPSRVGDSFLRAPARPPGVGGRVPARWADITPQDRKASYKEMICLGATCVYLLDGVECPASQTHVT